MTALICTLLALPCTTDQARVHQAGMAKHYSPGVMQQVIYNRTTPGRRGYIKGLVVRRDVAGYVSMQDCSTIGQVVFASVNGHAPERYQQMDCSHPRDVKRHRAQRLILELDYRSAVRVGIVRAGRGRALVWRAE